MNAESALRIRCDLASLDMARSGVIWGAIWIEAGAKAFPGGAWDDVPAAVLTAAIKATRSLRHPDMPTYFPFFDGPFDVRLDLVDAEMMSVRGRRNGQVCFQQNVLTRLWVGELRDCARAFVGRCAENGWGDSTDVVEVGDQWKAL